MDRLLITAPDAIENPSSFKKFLVNKEKLLDSVFDKSHIDNMYLVADAVERVLATGIRTGERIQQIDRGMGNVPILGDVYNKIKEYSDPRTSPMIDTIEAINEPPAARSSFAQETDTSNLGTSILQNPNLNPAAAASLYEGNLDQALANRVAPRMAAKGGIISLVT